MKCPECQTENDEPRRFCRKCGTKLLIICPNCGFENIPGDDYCGGCGQNLAGQDKTSSIKYSDPQSYTPRHLQDKILTIRSALEGERKLVTVLFADVANYTSISEKLDPEEVHQIMDGAFKILMDEIHRFEGTINQFTGDGVMALFGAPVAHEDHAQRACFSALSIQNAVSKYSESVKNNFGIDFVMRVGLNSGPVVVGAIGDDLRMDYTAIGDTTNLASRLENLAKPGSVLISKNTHKLVMDYFELNLMGKIQIKGKEESEEAYEVIKPSKIETRIHAATAKGLTKFIGRKNSMTDLMEPYEKVKAGSGQVVGIVGEAGVGKSRLILEFQDRLSQDEYTWLEGRCLHFGSSMAYLPILDILRTYFLIIEGDQGNIINKKIRDKAFELDAELASIVPPFQELLSLKADDEEFTGLEPQKKRERTFDALRDLFIRESQNKPLILVFEDLHWIDNTTQEYINYLIDWLGNTRIMLIILYRPEYIHQWGSKSYYSKIGLDQLGTNSSTELIRAILEGGDLAPELKKLVLTRVAGNPLFMEEFTHTLLENGSIQKENDKYVLAKDTQHIKVPDTIQGIIAARMDRLEDNLKRTMQVASVIGRDFAFRILQTITDQREELKSNLLNLQGLEFIYEKNLFPELEYIFKHALIQEVAYDSLLQTRRKEIHENIGEAIENLYANNLEEFYEMLAYHYSKSDNLEKTAYYLKQSGIKSMNSHAAYEGFNYFHEALDVLCRMNETPDNIKDQLEVIDLAYAPMVYLAYSADCLPILTRAQEIYTDLGDDRLLAKWRSITAKYYAYHAHAQEEILNSEKSFELANKVQDVDLMAEIAPGLHLSYVASGSYDKAAEFVLPLLELLEKTGRTTEYFGNPYILYCWLGGGCASMLGMLGQFEDGLALCEKTLRVAQESDSQITLGYTEFYCGGYFNQLCDFEKAKEYLLSSLAHFDEINFISVKGWLLSVLGLSCCYMEDFTAADEYFEQAIQFHKDSGIEIGKSLMYTAAGVHYYESGNLSRSIQASEKALKTSRQQNSKSDEGLALIQLGRTIGKMDPASLEIGEKYLLEGINIIKEMKLRPNYSGGYLFLGEMYTDAGRIDEARKYLEKAKNNFKAMGLDFWLNRTQAVLARL